MQPVPDPYAHAYAQPYSDPQAPARRAGVMMVVLGILLLLLGTCTGAASPLLKLDEMPPESREQFELLRNQYGVEPSSALLWTGVVLGVAGMFLIVLGVATRGGGLGSIITSIVVVSLLLLLLLLNLISALVTMQPGAMIMAMVMLGVFAVLLIFLIQAAGSASKVAAMKQAQAQYWAYAQQGYPGYGAQGWYPPPYVGGQPPGAPLPQDPPTPKPPPEDRHQ
jgi:hypothetical protein